MATINQEAVAELTAMGISEVDAVDCLKACNQNPNTAAEYYWNGDLEKARQSMKWDESAWQNEPETNNNTNYNYNNDYHPPFMIQGTDVLNSDAYNSGTKSRPPSRNSNRKNDDDGSYNRRNAISSWAADIPDPDLAQALAASMQAPGMSPQESGITGTHTSPTNPNFAPAQENKEYDPNQWSLTTTQANEVEIDPPADQRMRVPGAPVFIKPCKNARNVGGALAIMANIPRARHALLALQYQTSDYGQGEKWWNGERIAESRVIETERESGGEEYLRELQRVMALLDKSDRSYGSIEVLAQLSNMTDSRDFNGPSMPTAFFTAWAAATINVFKDDMPEVMDVFDSVAYQGQPSPDEPEEQTFQILEAKTSPDSPNLYSVMNTLIWGDDDNEVLLKFADVFTIQVLAPQGKTSTDTIIPADLYPDRYTEAWKTVSRELRKEIRQKREEIVELEVRAERLTNFQRRNMRDLDSSGKSYSPKTLLELTISHFETPVTKHDDDDDITMESQPDLDPTPILKELLVNLEHKLSQLEILQKEAREALEELNYKYTTPDEPLPPYHTLTRYSLRGICINSDVTYVAVRNEESAPSSPLPGMETAPPDPAPAPAPTDRWWRFFWQPTGASSGWNDPPTPGHAEIRLANLDEALHAARHEGESVLLIYARESALTEPYIPLPEALQTFVETDNALFAAELAALSSPEKKRRMSGAWLDDDSEMALLGNRASPKRCSRFSNSGSATPQDDWPNEALFHSQGDGVEIEMVERVPDDSEQVRSDGHV